MDDKWHIKTEMEKSLSTRQDWFITEMGNTMIDKRLQRAVMSVLDVKKYKEKSLYSLYVHSLCSDVSDHFFWSEYRVNRRRFHSLSSEFLLYFS